MEQQSWNYGDSDAETSQDPSGSKLNDDSSSSKSAGNSQVSCSIKNLISGNLSDGLEMHTDGAFSEGLTLNKLMI